MKERISKLKQPRHEEQEHYEHTNIKKHDQKDVNRDVNLKNGIFS